MAVALGSVKVKAAIVKIGPYVTAKGVTTPLDVGLTKGGVMLGYKPTYYPIEGDQYLGELAGVPTKRELEVKFTMTETDYSKLMLAFMMTDDVAHKAGTTPNWIINVDADSPEQYRCLTLSIPGGGLGTTGLRTINLHRTVCVACDPIPYKKDGEQLYAVTMRVYQEITGTGVDSFGNVTDT